MQAKLVVVGGDAKSKEVRLKLPTIVGRGKGSSLQLPQSLVSRQHCEIFESNGKLMVRDLGSLNGTFINNQRITEAELPAGELLTIGTVTFRAMYETADHQAPPAAEPQATVTVAKGIETISAKAPALKAPSAPAGPEIIPEKDEPIDFAQLIGEDEDDELSDFNLNTETQQAPSKGAASDTPMFALETTNTPQPADAAPTVFAPSATPLAIKVPAEPADTKSKTGPTPQKDAAPAQLGPIPEPAKPSTSDEDLTSFLKSLGK